MTPGGRLRLAAGPICEAKSFLGAGQVTCTAIPDGSDLKVVVHLEYPFKLNLLAGPPITTTFWKALPGATTRERALTTGAFSARSFA